MQQFVVPQFIEVEDKIFGPITTRQFLILLAGGLVVFIVYRLADFALFVTVLAVVGGLSLIFAFVKVNGQTFHYFVLNITQTLRKPGLRIWYNQYDDKELDYLRKRDASPEMAEKRKQKAAKRGRIRDLSLVVNTGGYYEGDDSISSSL